MRFLILWFLLYFARDHGAKATKLNFPRVLLPIFDKISINFTLEVIEKGCYKWVSSRQDLILITPVYDDSESSECSYRAVVTAISREKKRSTAIVLAEDTKTGDVLRCDVILDIIDKLGVLTTTRDLFLEEAPETFELWAQDSQGNAFTTLEGVEFEWAISSQNIVDGNRDASRHQVLRFLTFSDSKYHEVPKALETFESLGLKGYMVLLEGINTGTAKVAVRFPYGEYNHVPIIEVEIMVLANIILDPTDVHILVADTVDFRILQLKHGKLQEISLNSQYYLEIEDKSLATISGNRATGNQIGQTTVVLRDRNVPSERNLNSDGNTVKSPAPKATITITTAYKLTINLLPYYNWITVEGEKHEIAIELYTHDDQKIWLGPKYYIDSKFDESLFYPLKKSSNGSHIFGEAIKNGSTMVQGVFKKLSAKSEMLIYKELVLHPTKVILPFDPNSIKRQILKFVAEGGDGSFAWSSANANLVKISQSGVAETKIEGSLDQISEQVADNARILYKHTSIKVALVRNTKISRSAEIYFLPPVKLEIIKYNFETALKDYVKIHLGLYTFSNGTYIPFTNCANLNIEIEFTNQIFKIDTHKEEAGVDELAKDACRLIYLRGTSLGTTQVRIIYKFMDKILKDEATLVVFEPLNIVNPILNEVILPIGSSRNVIYVNGPQKIFNLEADLSKIIEYDRNLLQITEFNIDNSKQLYVLTILCKKVGDAIVELNMFNTLLTKNFDPYVSKFFTSVYCVKPRFINLYATEKLRPNCPLELKNSLMHVKDQKQNLEIEIEVLDSNNRKLMNISSLVINWQFAQGDEKYHADMFHYRESEEEIMDGVRLPSRELLMTAHTDTSARFKIKGIVTKYDSSVLDRFGIIAESPNFSIQKSLNGPWIKPTIENELNFLAVNSTLFPYSSISIFLAKNKPERISVAQGSGFYDIKLSENGIVSVEFDARKRELIIIPYQIGTVDIELIDRCLQSDSATLSVSVVSIGSIEARVADRVEKTKTINAIVQLYDSNGNNLIRVDSNDLAIYELHEEIANPSILNIRLGSQVDLRPGEIRFIVTGLELGETKVTFSSGYGETAVTSSPANIQVFPPLRLYPRNSTLVIGSSVQIYAHGGPHPDTNLVFSVQNQQIASMDSALVLAKKLGYTRITGKCVGIDPATGEKIVFSQDTIEIYVVPLDKIQIRTPLARIKSGAVMPAVIWGVPDLSPMVLGTLDSLKITWSTNQPDVLDIYGIFADAGIDYTENDLISVRVKALNPGKAKLQATVLAGNQKLSHSVDVIVFKMLELESPKHISLDSILIPPRTSIQLKANLDDAAYKLESQINGIVKVTPDGLVKSGETLGRDLIIASTYGQTLPIPIEVKNIQYIVASLQYPTIKLRQAEEKIPYGMNLILKISLHDNLGNEFSHNIEDVNGIKYDSSHKDMIDLQIGNNLTILLSLPRETSNMISISLKDGTGIKYSEDFIKLSVGESKHIFPQKTIFSAGDIICFDSPLAAATFWSSSDERVVTIDRNTGVARVISNRAKLGDKVTIVNGDKNNNFLKFDLEVRESDKIEFLRSFDVFSGEKYNSHLVIRNHLQMDKSSNLIAKNISRCASFVDKTPIKYFSCKLTCKHELGATVLKYFKTTPAFDKTYGTYTCEVDLTNNANELTNIFKTNEIHVELEAQLLNGISDVMSLKIVPAIKVTPETISTDQIAQGITITGLDKVLQKVEVKASDKSMVEITPLAKTHGSLQYKVKILNELPTDEQLFVHVSSPLTQQNIELPIQSPSEVQKCSTQPFYNSTSFLINIVSNIGLIISGIVVLIASIWVFIFCFPQRTRSDTNSQAFASFKSSPNVSNVSGTSFEKSQYTPKGPMYPTSPFFPNKSGGSQTLSSGNESPVYGDTTLISPQKRINRRYL